MKLKKLKLNKVLLAKKDMKQLAGGVSGSYRCGCGCGELPNGYTNAAGSSQDKYDEAWK